MRSPLIVCSDLGPTTSAIARSQIPKAYGPTRQDGARSRPRARVQTTVRLVTWIRRHMAIHCRRARPTRLKRSASFSGSWAESELRCRPVRLETHRLRVQDRVASRCVRHDDNAVASAASTRCFGGGHRLRQCIACPRTCPPTRPRTCFANAPSDMFANAPSLAVAVAVAVAVALALARGHRVTESQRTSGCVSSDCPNRSSMEHRARPMRVPFAPSLPVSFLASPRRRLPSLARSRPHLAHEPKTLSVQTHHEPRSLRQERIAT